MNTAIHPLNLAMDISGISLCLVGFLLLALSAQPFKRLFQTFLAYYSCMLLFILCNLFGQLYRGQPGEVNRLILFVTNFGEFMFPICLIYVISDYLLYVVDPEKKLRGYRTFINVVSLLSLALLVISQFTGLYYTIDDANLYQRSPGYFISFLPAWSIMLADMRLLVRYRHVLTAKQKYAFWFYFLVPLAMAVVQLYVYGLYLVMYATVMSAVVLLAFIISDTAEQYHRREREIAQLRLNAALKQIRPHFMYNTLTSIYVLCQDDPQQAMGVIESFIQYLRGNYNGLSATQPVSFEDELRHTQAYLSVEQMRFTDNLTVDYDLQDTRFSLPALSLQPIVENAVKHGVAATGKPTRILIHTAVENGLHTVTVTDDGPGFDVSILDKSRDGAIQSVRDRLKYMCGGTLTVGSTPGIGTTVTLSIPNQP